MHSVINSGKTCWTCLVLHERQPLLSMLCPLAPYGKSGSASVKHSATPLLGLSVYGMIESTQMGTCWVASLPHFQVWHMWKGLGGKTCSKSVGLGGLGTWYTYILSVWGCMCYHPMLNRIKTSYVKTPSLLAAVGVFIFRLSVLSLCFSSRKLQLPALLSSRVTGGHNIQQSDILKILSGLKIIRREIVYFFGQCPVN